MAQKKREVIKMFTFWNLMLILLVSPVAIVLVKAFIASKDYYDYDERKARYVSRIVK